jgi:hypothetical protein
MIVLLNYPPLLKMVTVIRVEPYRCSDHLVKHFISIGTNCHRLHEYHLESTHFSTTPHKDRPTLVFYIAASR